MIDGGIAQESVDGKKGRRSSRARVTLCFILVIAIGGGIVWIGRDFANTSHLRVQLNLLFERIEMGQTKDSVHRILGRPDATFSPSKLATRSRFQLLQIRGEESSSSAFEYWLSANHDFIVFVGYSSMDTAVYVASGPFVPSDGD